MPRNQQMVPGVPRRGSKTLFFFASHPTPLYGFSTILPHSVLLKRMKTDSQSFVRMTETLITQGDITPVSLATAGRPYRAYKLIGEG